MRILTEFFYLKSKYTQKTEDYPTDLARVFIVIIKCNRLRSFIRYIYILWYNVVIKFTKKLDGFYVTLHNLLMLLQLLNGFKLFLHLTFQKEQTII